MPLDFERHTWVEIDLDALRHNWDAVKARAGQLPLCAVVKADAYGHGAVPCARALAQAGAACLAVSCLAEGTQLRRAGLTLPILILGYTQPTFAEMLARQNLTQACFSAEYAADLSAQAKKAHVTVSVHLKADTGMGRIGFPLRTDFDAAVSQMLAVYDLPGLQVTGMFQHFSVADSNAPEDVAYTASQHELFCRAYWAMKKAGHAPELLHCDNSAAALLHPDWPAGLPAEHCMARPGIVLYGFAPDNCPIAPELRPVMQLKSLVSQVKTMQPGQSAGYGRAFTADGPTRVATLCTGYADGYPRSLSCGKGIVELHGKPAPILGRVCMDQLLVDVSHIPETAAGDEAILWGGAVSDSAQTIADKIGTISYEVLCMPSRRVPRIYRRGETLIEVADYLNACPGEYSDL